jgi:hypothetical protein
LISYADQAPKWRPKDGESFDLEDVRKDEECTDTVGVFLKVDGDDRVRFRVTLGPQVQTLTKAMTSILCRGLQDAISEPTNWRDIMELKDRQQGNVSTVFRKAFRWENIPFVVLLVLSTLSLVSRLWLMARWFLSPPLCGFRTEY